MNVLIKILGWTLITTTTSHALEIYSVLTKDCQHADGFFVGVDDQQVELLTLDGHYQVLNREELVYLAIYNTIDNPFKEITDHPRLRETLLEVYVDNKPNPTFIGWPVKFIENLVIFYDQHGKNYVIELFKIRKIRPYPKDKSFHAAPKNFQPIALSYKSWVTQCSLPSIPTEKAHSKVEIVRPTRMLSDQIQISEFLTQFQYGFENVRSFKERTYVYARPFLYEKSTRLGFLIFPAKSYILSPRSDFPIYFQWTRGREFRFQSFNQIGSVPVEYLPTVEPLSVFRSDLKSHIFHATFVGNLNALSAGTEYFTPLHANTESSSSDSSNHFNFNPKDPKFKSHSAASLNYMALMGGDWGPWSFSFGTYFPNYMIQVKEEFREILASQLAPLARIMYTGEKYRIYGIMGSTKLDQKNGVRDTQISRDDTISVVDYINDFNFSSYFLRGGIQYSLTSDIDVGLNQLWLQGHYNETLINAENNNFDFSHLVTQGSVRHSFGEYVALRLYLELFQISESYRFSGINDSHNHSETTYGGTFEFIF